MADRGIIVWEVYLCARFYFDLRIPWGGKMLNQTLKAKIIILGAMLFGISASVSELYARQLVPKKAGVKVFETASRKGAVVKQLNKSESVEELGRSGMFWKVKLGDGKEGFVSVMKVKRKPSNKSGEFSTALRKAIQQGRSADDASNVRNRSAVMGVRGLDESDDTAFAGNVKPNPRLVVAMENLNIDPKSVENIGNLVEREIELKLKRME